MTPWQTNMVLKTQQVRLMDTFFLGPFMVYAASLIPEEHSLTRTVLALSGIMTSAFNFHNYLSLKKEME